MDPAGHNDDISAPVGKRRRWMSWLSSMNPAGRIEATDPGKELRFTRSGQALHFAVAAIICACVAFTLLTLGLWPWHPDGSPCLTVWWPCLLPLLPMLAFLWLAIFSHSWLRWKISAW